MLKFNLSLSSSDTVTVKKPEGVSISAFNRDPKTYVTKLDQRRAIGLAKYFDHWYHTKSNPKTEDSHYDVLVDHIGQKWPKSRYLKKVGSTPTKSSKRVRLPVYMPSLTKIKSTSAGLDKFFRGPFVVSEKLDGISLLLEYRDHVPYACYLRGDGTTGQNASNVLSALRIPRRISASSMLVRCEFIIRRTSFNKHSDKNGGDYKTARNMGGGLLNRNQPSSAIKDFDVIAYEICDTSKKPSAQLQELKREGFHVVRHKRVSSMDANLASEYLRKLKSTTRYEIDGIVLAQDVTYHAQASNPKHARAFKENTLEASKVVKVQSVEWRRTRHGRFVPRVVINPTDLGGVTVTYLTGHSYYYIQHGFRYADRSKGLPVRPIAVGASIRVIRSGDVIPYIMEVVRPARKPSQPNQPFVLDKNNVHAHEVEKSMTDSSSVQTLTHFFSAMQMKGIKAGLITQLYDAGFNSLRKILHASPGKLLDAGFGEKTVENIRNIIDAGLNSATFARTAYASSVFGDNIGESRLQAVIDAYPDILEISRSQDKAAVQDMLEEVPGIKTQARTIARGLPKFDRFLQRNRIAIQKEAEQQSNSLDGMKVLFTSVRDESLLQQILQNGGKKAGSVKTATHLIAKPGASNSKIDAAQQKNIPVYSPQEFRAEFELR